MFIKRETFFKNYLFNFVATRMLVALRATHARRHCAFGATWGRPGGDLGGMEDLSKHLGDILGTLETLWWLYKQGPNFSDTHTQFRLVIRYSHSANSPVEPS